MSSFNQQIIVKAWN